MVYSLINIKDAAAVVCKELDQYKVVAFHGEMGSGKTTLISAICSLLGTVSDISSPTFSIIQEYMTTTGMTIYHIDLYRIKNVQEAIEAGVEETIYSGELCFVEWPEKAPGIFSENTLHVSINPVDEFTRELSMKAISQKSF